MVMIIAAIYELSFTDDGNANSAIIFKDRSFISKGAKCTLTITIQKSCSSELIKKSIMLYLKVNLHYNI